MHGWPDFRTMLHNRTLLSMLEDIALDSINPFRPSAPGLHNDEARDAPLQCCAGHWGTLRCQIVLVTTSINRVDRSSDGCYRNRIAGEHARGEDITTPRLCREGEHRALRLTNCKYVAKTCLFVSRRAQLPAKIQLIQPQTRLIWH